MKFVVLYAVTAVVFLALDAVMLRTVISPLFRAHLGDALLATPRMGAAALFYLVYVLGVLILVSVPALADGAPLRAAWQGAVLGLVAYGTYEMTNYATLKAWTTQMVMTDWAWGTVLTGLSAWAGVAVVKQVYG